MEPLLVGHMLSIDHRENAKFRNYIRDSIRMHALMTVSNLELSHTRAHFPSIMFVLKRFQTEIRKMLTTRHSVFILVDFCSTVCCRVFLIIRNPSSWLVAWLAFKQIVSSQWDISTLCARPQYLSVFDSYAGLVPPLRAKREHSALMDINSNGSLSKYVHDLIGLQKIHERGLRARI